VLTRGKTPVPAQYRAVRADRKNPDLVRSALKNIRPDAVINFIGYDVSDVQLDFEVFSGVVAQYIFISSATVYSKPPKTLPITENCVGR